MSFDIVMCMHITFPQRNQWVQSKTKWELKVANTSITIELICLREKLWKILRQRKGPAMGFPFLLSWIYLQHTEHIKISSIALLMKHQTLGHFR